MVKMNSRMQQIIKRIERNKVENKMYISYANLNKILLPKFIEVEDCILLDINVHWEKEKIDMEWVLETYLDKTGFEASSMVAFSLQLIECWGYKLKYKYPEDKFNFILGINGASVTLRFYKFRENDLQYLADDLEKYEEEAMLLRQI